MVSQKHRTLRRRSTLSLLALLALCAVAGYAYLSRQPQAKANLPPQPLPFQSIRMIPKATGGLPDTGHLSLVNGQHPLPETASWEMVPAYRMVPLSQADITLHPDALDALDGMLEAMAGEGMGDVVVTSGHRTRQRQEELYTYATDQNYVQPPGFSEHETGLAVDIQLINGGTQGLEETRQGQWLAGNGWQHGFILRYPQDKQDITGIAYEPWHFRYVGQPHAAFIRSQGLCLEEYLDGLDGQGYAFILNGKHYQVYRTVEQDGAIQVPGDHAFTLSSDNRGGYIVTVSMD